jgi:hypothetical protein
MFKILKGIEKVDFNAPVKLAPSLASSGPAGSIRGHKIRIEIEIVKNCDHRKHFLTNRVANAWNKLPGEVVRAPSANSFKAKIDQINETNVKRTRSKL